MTKLFRIAMIQKSAVPLDADALRIPAPLPVAGPAVAAVSADDVPLAGDDLSHVIRGDASTQLLDLAHVFMTDGRFCGS